MPLNLRATSWVLVVVFLLTAVYSGQTSTDRNLPRLQSTEISTRFSVSDNSEPTDQAVLKSKNPETDRKPSGRDSAFQYDTMKFEDHTEEIDPEIDGWLSRGQDAAWVFSDVREFRKFLSAPQISTFSKNYMVLMSVLSILQTDAQDKGFAENFHDLVHLFEEGHLPFEETRIVLLRWKKRFLALLPNSGRTIGCFLSMNTSTRKMSFRTSPAGSWSGRTGITWEFTTNGLKKFPWPPWNTLALPRNNRMTA